MAKPVAVPGRKGAKPALPLVLAAMGLAFGLPSTGLAVVAITGQVNQGVAIFTPASVEPALARAIAERAAGNRPFRFTPAGKSGKRDRPVTVAVRIDSDIAQAISVRSAIDAAGGAGTDISAISSSRYDLGAARGYKSFARPAILPDSVRRVEMPDLASFKPAVRGSDEPDRFRARIALEGKGKAGRSEGTFEALGSQTVDLGGAYSLSRNLDVTAGVRLSQERDRLAPLTDSVQDSQAVYVGTQLRF